MYTMVKVDKVWMYEERMMNNDNLESNLLTSSLLKRCLVYMLVKVELRILCTGDLPLQVNYAVERLMAVAGYCFRVVLIMPEIDWLTLKEVDKCSPLSYSIND